jgi:opacity protein-like surface antigen
MKKILIVLMLISPLMGISQEAKERKLELVFQGSYLKGMYVASYFDKLNFFANYYIHTELNYAVKSWMEVGGYFAYSPGQSIETDDPDPSRAVGRIYRGHVFYMGSNFNFFPMSLLYEDLKVFKILQPYFTVEGGYLYFKNPEPSAKPLPQNGFNYSAGVGLRVNATKKFAINGEYIYNNIPLVRIGVGFKL